MRFRSRPAERTAHSKEVSKFNLGFFIDLEVVSGLKQLRKSSQLWNARVITGKVRTCGGIAKAQCSLTKVVPHA